MILAMISDSCSSLKCFCLLVDDSFMRGAPLEEVVKRMNALFKSLRFNTLIRPFAVVLATNKSVPRTASNLCFTLASSPVKEEVVGVSLSIG